MTVPKDSFKLSLKKRVIYARVGDEEIEMGRLERGSIDSFLDILNFVVIPLVTLTILFVGGEPNTKCLVLCMAVMLMALLYFCQRFYQRVRCQESAIAALHRALYGSLTEGRVSSTINRFHLELNVQLGIRNYRYKGG